MINNLLMAWNDWRWPLTVAVICQIRPRCLPD